MAGPLRHGLVRLPLVRTRRRQRNRSAPAATSALLASRFRLAAPGVASRARTTSARPRVRRPLRRGGDGYYLGDRRGAAAHARTAQAAGVALNTPPPRWRLGQPTPHQSLPVPPPLRTSARRHRAGVPGADAAPTPPTGGRVGAGPRESGRVRGEYGSRRGESGSRGGESGRVRGKSGTNAARCRVAWFKNRRAALQNDCRRGAGPRADFKSSGAARGSLPHAQALRRPQPATALRADVRADRLRICSDLYNLLNFLLIFITAYRIPKPRERCESILSRIRRR
ncbi:hypothetical protein T492DRAFT_30898 [Pavlovales sp. CCMP2436]|nr:hypothetical protein T492DRAFT_30898 [Pavlovales sp. CCMP2436]